MIPKRSILSLWAPFIIFVVTYGIGGGGSDAQELTKIENIVSRVKDQNAVTNIYYLQGTVWVCTEGGVLKYGGTWTSWNSKAGLGDAHVNSMTEDAAGRLWFGTKNGVSVYDGKWKTYRAKDGLPSDIIYDVSVGPQEDIWVGTDAGLGIFRGDRWIKLGFGDDGATPIINRIVRGPGDTMWIATYTTGIGVIEGAVLRIIDRDSGLPANLITAIRFDKNGDAWVGTSEGLCLLRDGKVKKKFTVKDGLLSNEVTSIEIDAEGKVWVGFWGGGVGIYDGKTWKFLSAESGIVDDRVTAIAMDGDGTMWIGCWGGISKISK